MNKEVEEHMVKCCICLEVGSCRVKRELVADVFTDQEKVDLLNAGINVIPTEAAIEAAKRYKRIMHGGMSIEV